MEENKILEYVGIKPEDYMEEIETERCSGHCCKRFPLSSTYEELKNMVEGCTIETKVARDNKIILDMLIPLGVSKIDFNGEVRAEAREWFTCKHLAENGDCKIYADRPYMCEAYPSYRKSPFDESIPCQHKDCTRKTKLVPIEKGEENV